MSQSIGSKVKTFFKSIMKPSPTAVFQAAKALNLKPHTPLIKFRYGGGGGGSAASHSGLSASPVLASAAPTPAPSRGAQPSSAGGGGGSRSAPTSPSKPNATVALPTIEDWQLPARYQRRPIDQTEIDYINRGGPA